MGIPGFTAEASLGKIKGSYALTSEAPAETGKILPQGTLVRQTGDGVDIIHCYDEGGFSGCWTQHIRLDQLF